MTHERVKKKNKQRASEMNLAAILLCIVFLFLVCHFPRILLNVHEIFMLGDMMACGNGKTFIAIPLLHFSKKHFYQSLFERVLVP